jgi:PAS domain S-box-containing protein
MSYSLRQLPAGLVDDMLYICVIAEDEAGTIAYANLKLHELLGYDWPELNGQSLDVLVPDESREAHKHYRMGFMQRPTMRPMDGRDRLVQIRTKAGEVRDVMIGLGPENVEGKPMVGGAVTAIIVPLPEHLHERH